MIWSTAVNVCFVLQSHFLVFIVLQLILWYWLNQKYTREMYPISMQALKSAAKYWLHVTKSENSDKYDAYLSSLKLGWCNQREDLFRFLLGFLQKKNIVIEYLVQVLWLERNRCQMLDHFRWAKRRRWQFISLKMILRPILPVQHWTYTYCKWNMYCIERITHLRNPISYIWFIFSHIYSNNKGTLQFFHDFKEDCRITMEFSDKVDSMKYSTVP
jgi:hypothetical protein